MRRLVSILSIGFALVLLSGCWALPPKKFYTGEEIASEQVATVWTDANATIRLYQVVPGKSPKRIGQLSVGRRGALLPGQYIAEVTFSKSETGRNPWTNQEVTRRTWSIKPDYIKFALKGGTSYRLSVEHLTDTTWRAIMTDQSSRTVISERTRLS